MKKTNLMKLVLLSMSAALVFGCQQVTVKEKKKQPERNEEREESVTAFSSTPEVHTVKCSASTTVTTGQGHLMGDKEAVNQGHSPVPAGQGNSQPAKCSTRRIPPAELPTTSEPTSAVIEEMQPTAHVEIAPEVEELI